MEERSLCEWTSKKRDPHCGLHRLSRQNVDKNFERKVLEEKLRKKTRESELQNLFFNALFRKNMFSKLCLLYLLFDLFLWQKFSSSAHSSERKVPQTKLCLSSKYFRLLFQRIDFVNLINSNMELRMGTYLNSNMELLLKWRLVKLL